MISKETLRLWYAPKPIRKDFGMGNKPMPIFMSDKFYEDMLERYPSTHISIIHAYRLALKNNCYYRIHGNLVRIVGLGVISNYATQFEFSCTLCADGNLYVDNVFEGSSTVGKWKSVKSEGRKQ